MMYKADFKYSFTGFFRWPVLVTLTLIFAASLWLEFRGIDIGLPSRERLEVSLGGEAVMQRKLPEIRQALSNNVAERSEFRDKGDKEYFGELAGFSPYFDQVRSINPDEFHVFKAIAKMKKERTLNPGYYIYGPFYIYQVGAALAAGKVLGVIDSGKGAEYYLSHPEQFAVVYLCGRYLSAIMVSLAVVVTFLIGYRIGRLPLAAFASSLLAFIPIVMLCGKFIKPDSALLFWSSLTLLFAIPALTRARWKDYLLTGLFIGLCAATKYPGVFTCSYLVMFHLMRRYSEWHELPSAKRKFFSSSDWKLVAAGGVCCVTFLMVNFAIWADMPTFLNDFKWVL
ncbi:MAG: phospholipid carrier-dependent glycosyltransferase, partial [Victivallaceae bacterium]